MASARREVTDLPPRPRARLKAAWIAVHKYLGLILGALLAVLGLSGSLNVYAGEIETWLHPSLYADARPAPAQSIDTLVAASLRDAPPGTRFAAIVRPTYASGTVVVTLHAADGLIDVHMDAASGERLGERANGNAFPDIILAFHHSFMLDQFGPRVSGVLGVALLVSIGSGLYVWWPRARDLARSLKVGWHTSARRFNYEFHRTLGVGVAPLLVLSAVTGIYQAFPEPFLALVPPADGLRAGGITEPATPGRAAALASIVFPGSELRRVDYLDGEAPAYRVIAHAPVEPRFRGGESRLWIDARTGRITRLRDPGSHATATRVLGWLPPLHAGDALGPVGRAFMFIAGLVPAVLLTTGLRLWWLRRPKARDARLAPHAGISE